MKTVYLLQHVYQYGAHHEHEEVKTLGIFDNEKDLTYAINKYKTLPGFKDFSEECFSVDKYELNKMEWDEGFIEL